MLSSLLSWWILALNAALMCAIKQCVLFYQTVISLPLKITTPHCTRVCNTFSCNCMVSVPWLSMCVHFAHGEQVNAFCSAVFNHPMKLA